MFITNNIRFKIMNSITSMTLFIAHLFRAGTELLILKRSNCFGKCGKYCKHFQNLTLKYPYRWLTKIIAFFVSALYLNKYDDVFSFVVFRSLDRGNGEFCKNASQMIRFIYCCKVQLRPKIRLMIGSNLVRYANFQELLKTTSIQPLLEVR